LQGCRIRESAGDGILREYYALWVPAHSCPFPVARWCQARLQQDCCVSEDHAGPEMIKAKSHLDPVALPSRWRDSGGQAWVGRQPASLLSPLWLVEAAREHSRAAPAMRWPVQRFQVLAGPPISGLSVLGLLHCHDCQLPTWPATPQVPEVTSKRTRTWHIEGPRQHGKGLSVASLILIPRSACHQRRTGFAPVGGTTAPPTWTPLHSS
jgi:hypothetical protein